jgi:predicted nucleic acid-binding protein
MPETPETDPARIVADADVLAADLLVGGSEAQRASAASSEGRSPSGHASGHGPRADGERSDLRDGAARDAMDEIRSHSWVELVASDPLLDDAETVISTLADSDLAAAWRERIEALRVPVEHPEGDHPALASAYQGQAAHILSYDENLRSAEASATFGSRLNVSVKTPAGFAALFDAESLYEAVEGGEGGESSESSEYPGPDRNPRE